MRRALLRRDGGQIDAVEVYMHRLVQIVAWHGVWIIIATFCLVAEEKKNPVKEAQERKTASFLRPEFTM